MNNNKKKLDDAWIAVCDQIKTYEGIDISQFNAFFSRLHPMAMSDDFFMLTADNDFIKMWIERHYLHYIRQGLADLYGNPFTIMIEVDPQDTEAGDNSSIKNYFKEDNPEQTEEKRTSTQPQTFPITSQDPQEIYEESDESSEEIDNYVSIENLQESNSSFSFGNFVLGDSNRMAYSMALSVAETPGKPHLNPLFIYGKSGLGKTHLMLAIQNYIKETQPALRSVYVDSHELLDDYIEAAAAHSYKQFKTKYEDVDVLLIDDVQYFQGKTQTLEIVFQIFNKLSSQGKQIVLSADRAPKNIDIDERYKTRFNSGGTVDIQPPELETKLGIIKCFIEEYKNSEGLPNFDIPKDIQSYTAEISSSNIRELKAAITRIIFLMNEQDQAIELEDVQRLLENHFSGGSLKRLTITDIQKQVESFYKVSHSELVGKKRSRNITHARYVAIYLCRVMLDKPYNDIGRNFNRDHTTVMYAFNNVEEKIKSTREIREEIENIMRMIKED